jgi:hypothetical protein
MSEIQGRKSNVISLLNWIEQERILSIIEIEGEPRNSPLVSIMFVMGAWPWIWEPICCRRWRWALKLLNRM